MSSFEIHHEEVDDRPHQCVTVTVELMDYLVECHRLRLRRRQSFEVHLDMVAENYVVVVVVDAVAYGHQIVVASLMGRRHRASTMIVAKNHHHHHHSFVAVAEAIDLAHDPFVIDDEIVEIVD